MSVIDTLITDRTTADVAALMALYSKPRTMWSGNDLDLFLNGDANILVCTDGPLECLDGYLRLLGPTGMRGAYNASDMNRVGESMEYIAAILNGYGYSVHVSPDTWSIGEMPTASQFDHYLADVRTLRAALTVLPTTPTVPADMDGLTVNEANAIEQILVDLDAQLRTMATTFVPCGGALCGGDYL